MRKCFKCQEIKENNYFSKDKNRKGGITYDCKECRSKYQKQYYSDNEIRIRRRHSENYDVEYHRKYRTEHREENNEWKRKYLSTDYGRKRHLARTRLNDAVKGGKVIKGDCAYPNGNCKGRMEAHHWDYSKPLDVVWFCRKHHEIADKIQKLKSIHK